jgi:hypothetical protein
MDIDVKRLKEKHAGMSHGTARRSERELRQGTRGKYGFFQKACLVGFC